MPDSSNWVAKDRVLFSLLFRVRCIFIFKQCRENTVSRLITGTQLRLKLNDHSELPQMNYPKKK